jgi:DNA-binding GntR family transcriptional regulator
MPPLLDKTVHKPFKPVRTIPKSKEVFQTLREAKTVHKPLKPVRSISKSKEVFKTLREGKTVHKPFKPVRSISKSKEVFQTLREAILSGDLLPGDPLKEAHLARQLHVSQVPVREALLQLEHLGLVVRVPDRGTTVTKLSREGMIELLQVRAHLEELAFGLAMRRLTDDAIKDLRACIADLERKSAKNDYYGAAEADLRFHQTVWRYSGNRVLENTLERLCTSVMAFVSIQRHAAGESLGGDIVGRHNALLEALEKRNSRAVSAAIREHTNPANSVPSSVE